MSLLSDLGTKIGTELKSFDNRIFTLENTPTTSSLDNGGTIAGDLTIQKNGSTQSTGDGDVIGSATIKFVDTNNNQNVELAHDPFDGSVGVSGYTGYGLRLRKTADNAQQQYNADLFVEGDVYVNNTKKVMTGTKTISTSTPSGGVSGDIWIQV